MIAKKILTFSLVGMLVFAFTPSVRAADLNITANTTLELSGLGINLIALSGGTADSLTVHTGHVEITLSGGHAITLRSENKYNLEDNTLGAAPSCDGDSSQVTISLASGAAQQTVTVTPILQTYNCGVQTVGGGGGGGSSSSGGGGGSSSSSSSSSSTDTDSSSSSSTGSATTTPVTSPQVERLVKLTCQEGAGVNDPCRAVYTVGADGGRYAFPNQTTYFSRYDDFSSVVEISAEELANYPLRGNVTIKPGAHLVKVVTLPYVYAVEPGGVLRWVETEAIARSLWGDTWAQQVVDIPDEFFTNYQVNEDAPITGLHPTGTLVKYPESDTVYYIDQGTKREIVGTDTLTANGFRESSVLTIDESLVYPDGQQITGVEGSLNVL